MKNKKRSSSSNRWLKEYFNDRYAQQVQKNRLRSRAWFKLDEIQKNDKIFKPGMIVIDLGAAPGGWSKYAITQIGKIGRVIACDLLPMSPIYGVDFLLGDLRDQSVFKTLLKRISNNKVQVVMSDMAPNICGISAVDIPRTMYLADLALKVCKNTLETDGSFITKMFMGQGFENYLKKILFLFKKIRIRKPCSSRSRSREIYIVATGHKS